LRLIINNDYAFRVSRLTSQPTRYSPVTTPHVHPIHHSQLPIFAPV